MVRKIIYKLLSRRRKTKNGGFISKLLLLITPLVNLLEKLGLRFILDFVIVHLIRFYQKYLSPRKGFSCAYSKLYKSSSCSEYFRQTVKTQGLQKAIPLFQKRLRECKLANIALKERFARNRFKNPPQP